MKKLEQQSLSLGVNKLWETIVYYTQFKDKELEKSFTQDILENMDLYISNSKESQDASIFDIDRPIIQKFKNELVIPIAQEYLKIIDVSLENYEIGVRGWLTGQLPYYSLGYHNHKSSFISAIFYPFIGEDTSGGQVVFHDPRTNANRGYVNNFSKLFEHKSFSPSTGDILVFPSFLYHHVNTYFSKMRIGIAVDYFTELN